MAPRKASRNLVPDQEPSPRRLRPRRGVAQEAEQQAPTPAPSTKTSTRTTSRKPATKSAAASKAAPKAGSKSNKVTKPRGKAATKNRKTMTNDAPAEPLDTTDPDHVATTEDHLTDAPVDPATIKTPAKSSKAAKPPAKTPSKTPSKTRTSKKGKTLETDQKFVRATRQSVQQGWQSPLSDQVQSIIGLLPKIPAKQDSTPLSIVKESEEKKAEEKQEEWFEPQSAAPYGSAQKSAQKSPSKCEHDVFSLQPASPLPAIVPAQMLSSPYCPPSVSQIAGVQETPLATPGQKAQASSVAKRALFGRERGPATPAAPEGSPAFNSPAAFPLGSPCPPVGFVPVLEEAEMERLLAQVETLRGLPRRTFLHQVSRLGGATVAWNLVAAVLYRAPMDLASEPESDYDMGLVADNSMDAVVRYEEDDELHESPLEQPDDDEAMSDGSYEATEGQDDDLDDDDAADADSTADADPDVDASTEGTPRPETPLEEFAPTSPTSTYYLAGLFNTGKSILKKINPFAARTPAPAHSITVKSPRPALTSSTKAHLFAARSPPPAPRSPTLVRSSRKPGPVTPRIKNADQRHDLAVANKEKRDQMRRKKEVKAAEVQEAAEQAAEQIAQQVPGQKRRRCKIPAHLPGERGYGVVDEYFELSEEKLVESFGVDESDDGATTGESSPVYTPATKRRKVFEELENEDPRLTEPFGVATALDVERAEDHLEGTLRRPRNALRRAFERQTGKDLGDKHHQTKIQHHENSFSRTPLRDSQPSVNRRTSNEFHQSTSSTIYTGSALAVPGDPGYKDNVFTASDMQVTTEQREQMSKRGQRKSKMSRKEHKTRAEAIALKASRGQSITEEEEEELESAQRRFGHIRGTGHYGVPEYGSTDEETEIETEPDSTDTSFEAEPVSYTASTDSSFEAEHVAFTVPEQASSIMPPAPNAAVTAPAIPAAKKPLAGILKKPASAMAPPPTPKPANAQLPASTAGPSTPKAAVAELPAKTQPAVSSHKLNISSNEETDRPLTALDRVRQIAEKHKTHHPTPLSRMKRVSSSPVQPSSPVSAGEAETPMSKSLLTQSTDLPAVEDQEASAFEPYKPFVPTSNNLPWSPFGNAVSEQAAQTPVPATNTAEAAKQMRDRFKVEIAEDARASPTPGLKRKRFEDEEGGDCLGRKSVKLMKDQVEDQVHKARCDFLAAHETRLTAAFPSDGLNTFLSSKCRARYEKSWDALLARGQANA